MHKTSYASFLQRFGAMWIDFFVFLPIVVLRVWLESRSKVAAIILVIPMACLFAAYHIYCHGRYGKTVGKHVMSIRVVRTTGERIGWREAWLRSSVDIVLMILTVVSSMIALTAISDSEYYGLSWADRARTLQSLEPVWLAWVSTASACWIWSEVIVMLFNKRRRALHDFIAGTVVIAEAKCTTRVPGIA